MVQIKRISGTKINKRQGTAGKRRMTRNSEGKQELVERDIQRQMDQATDWTPHEGALYIREKMPAASADFTRDLFDLCAQCKRMYPGLTLSGLREKVSAIA